MRAKDNKIVKIDRYKKRWKWNLGLFLFFIILAYLLILCIRIPFRGQTSAYEVRKGSIINDTIYTGLVLREESVVSVDDGNSGYIEYYYPELSRVGVGSHIYTISSQETNIEIPKQNEPATLTNIQEQELKNKIQLLNTTYEKSDFDYVYRFKNEVETILNTNENKERVRILNQIFESNSGLYNIYDTEKSGYILYEIDGYEDIKWESLSNEFFQKQDYAKKLLYSGQEVSTGDHAYKILTSENWCIYINIDDNDINLLKNVTNLEIRFLKDDLIVPASFSIKQINGMNYGELVLNEGMVRYATDRFLDIELIFETQQGFKIPRTSVTQQSFYKIPFDFVSSGNKVLIKDDKNMVYQKSLNVYYYYIDEFDKSTNTIISAYYYIPLDNLKLNDLLIQEDTNNEFLVSETEILHGVYNLNKGYSTLTYVDILNQSDEYYIIRELSNYSVLNYDYIALYADKQNEGNLVY